MVEVLECSGIVTAVEPGVVKPVAKLRASCRASNNKLLRQLVEGSRAEHLLESANEDEALGRLSGIAPIEVCCLKILVMCVDRLWTADVQP